jgi:shikimate dehydrogenase
MISGKTGVFAIFGYPVEHTFSPGMHNAAFRQIRLNACYVPFAVHPDRLRDAVRSIVPLGLRGLNITVPHKETVIPFLDELTEDARLIGAVNTIEVRGDRLIGHNTDGRGFLRSLQEETSFRPKGKTVLIVGAGGAARSVAFNLALAGAGTVLLHDVDRSKAGRLAQGLQGGTPARAIAISADELRAYAREAHCLINATPLGLKRGDDLPVPKDCIREDILVCDLVYNPPLTPLLKAARSRGAMTLAGIGMLLYQGVIAFEIWTGKKAPVTVMKKALIRQIRGRRK